jgi:hypothetical protein
MINEFNIEILNYIYSINEDMHKGIKEDKQEYRNKLDSLIKDKFSLSDFWDEYLYMFNDKCVVSAPTLNGMIFTYRNFPRMKSETKLNFLNYKMEQIEQSIRNNGELENKDLEKIFINIENYGRKTILDYCKEKGIIEYNGTVFINSEDNPASEIIYENIKPIICKEKDNKVGFIQNNMYVGEDNYGAMNQSNNINNEDELYKLVLEKLDAMQLGTNISQEKIDELKIACEAKKKKNVIGYLKEISVGATANLIASGILYKFGIM